MQISLFVFLLLLSSVLAVAYTPKEILSPKGSVPLYKSTFEGLYYANVEVGTPPQVQRAIIDTELDLSVFISSTTCPDLSSMHCLNYASSYTATIEGDTEDGFCKIIEDVMGFQGLNYTATNRYCLTGYNARFLGLMQSIDGYLGLGYMTNGEDRETFNYWMSIVPPDWPSVYALRLKGEDGDSMLDIGGYEHGTEVIWSEKQTNFDTEDILFIEAPLFHISMCGERLLPDVSFTSAQFVTAHNCLALPQDLFARVLDWLDSCYEDGTKDIDNGHIVCQLPVSDEADALDALPSISFKLSEDGELLRLSLSALVTFVERNQHSNSNTVDATVCITRSKQYGTSHDKEKIIFGILPMENFYTVVNAEELRVGLVQYSNFTEEELNYACPAVSTCKGEQTYNAPHNKCYDPLCRFFQYVDDDTKTCKLSIIFVVLTTALLVTISTIDFCVAESKSRLDRRIRTLNNNQ